MTKTKEEKGIDKVKKTLKKILPTLSLREGELNWIVPLDNDEDKRKLYLIRAINKYNNKLGNIWDTEKKDFLLLNFMPVESRPEPIIVFGTNLQGYEVFSYKDQEIMQFGGQKFNRIFYFYGMIALTNHFAQMALLRKDSDYAIPEYRYMAKKPVDTDNGEEFEITKSTFGGFLTIKSNRDTQKYLYDIKNHELVEVG